jgi:DnaJ-class molecular chaperone
MKDGVKGEELKPTVCFRCCGGGQVYASALEYPHNPTRCPDCDGTGKVLKPAEKPHCDQYHYTVEREERE